MERESSFKDPLKPISMKFDASHKPKDEPNQKRAMEAGTSEYPFARPWMAAHSSMPAQSNVNFLTESSAFLPLSSYEDMLERIPSSVGGVHDGGLSELQRDLLYGSSKASGSKSLGFSMDMDSWKHFTSLADTVTGDSLDISQADQKLALPAPVFPSRPRPSTKAQKAHLTDRQARRIRIAERLLALEELLPHPVEGGQELVLDEVIDHIKFLQLKIKDLSKSRLGGEAVAEPMIFREGYGHYFLHQQILSEPVEEMSEPLEEIIGKLLETDPVAADKLLRDKGLSLVPLGWTEKLF